MWRSLNIYYIHVYIYIPSQTQYMFKTLIFRNTVYSTKAKLGLDRLFLDQIYRSRD